MGSVVSCSTPGFQSEILSRRGRKLAVCVKRNNYSGCIVGRAIGLMPLIFPEHGVLHELWGGPQGRALWATGRPRPALLSKNQAPPQLSRPARGPAGPKGTPEGVRPTNYADVRMWENYVALPLRSRLCQTRMPSPAQRGLDAAPLAILVAAMPLCALCVSAVKS